MTIKVLVGVTEGFVSSVGFSSEGVNFLARGEHGRGLHWEGRESLTKAVVELKYILGYLQAGGNVVEGEEQLDTLLRPTTTKEGQ
jgi:hypothetical protein